MKRTHLNLPAFLVILSLLWSACSNESSSSLPPEEGSSSPFITISAKDGKEVIEGIIDLEQKTVQFSFAQEAELDSIKISFSLAEGVTLISPKLSGCDTLDLRTPIELVFKQGKKNYTYQLSANTSVLFKSARLGYCYYTIPGKENGAERRLDFEMPLYTTEKPNLSHIPVVIEPKEGVSFPDAVNDTLWVNFEESGMGTPLTVVYKEQNYTYQCFANVAYKEAARTEFTMNYGTNLCYWFQEPPGVWYNVKEIDQVVACGFDHIRLPFDSKVLFAADGTLQEKNMQELHYIIKYCLNAGLNVILDMHWLRYGNGFPDARSEKELAHNWTVLKEEFKQYPNDRVAYEILNEPWGNGLLAWYGVAKKMTALIRSTEPERIIFISTDGYEVNFVHQFDGPKGDPNIVMAFHFYEPMLFSHRKLWGYTGPSHYPGFLFSDEEWEAMSDVEKERAQHFRRTFITGRSMQMKMANAASYAQKYGVRIHCGEFGASKTNIRSERVQWFKDVVAAFKAANIPYTCWETFGGDFGCGTSGGSPDEEIVDILVQRD